VAFIRAYIKANWFVYLSFWLTYGVAVSVGFSVACFGLALVNWVRELLILLHRLWTVFLLRSRLFDVLLLFEDVASGQRSLLLVLLYAKKVVAWLFKVMFLRYCAIAVKVDWLFMVGS
jgi:hypothetical protein